MKIKNIILNDSEDTFAINGVLAKEELVTNQIGEMRESILINSRCFDIPVNLIVRGRGNNSQYLKLPRKFYSKFTEDIRYFGKFVVDSNGKEYFIMECGDNEISN